MLRHLQIFGKRRDESRDSRADAYPMPRVPAGWYGVLRSDELAIGELKSLHYFGKDLIAFRTPQGRATVLDAFCPHYGAHLGAGGRLVGDQIECPFHGWRFGSDGRCTHAPFVQQPPKASIGCHRVHEHSGVIFVYAGPGAPTWEVPPIPEAADERFGPALYRDYRVRTHVQEMRENLVDEAHFQFIHGASRPVEQEFVPNGRFARVSMRFGKPLLWGRGRVDSEFRGEMYGPGVALVRVTTSIMDISAIALTTPVDEQLSEMRMIYLIKRPPFAPLLHPLLRAIFRITAYGEVDAEAAIWDRKIYQRRPILLPHEKGIRALRRWYEQFYEVDPTETSGEKSASPARHGAPDIAVGETTEAGASPARHGAPGGSEAWSKAGE